ncbi:MAG: hypothetical protein K0S65_5845 [Labilithrix sp.]|nr:hypothetical protein [Labilithrix sp.]
MSLFHQNREARPIVLAMGAATLVHALLLFLSTRSGPRASAALDANASVVEVALLEATTESAIEVPREQGATSVVEDRSSHGTRPARAEARAAAPAANESPSTDAPSQAVVEAPGSAAPVMLFTPPPSALGIAGSGPNPFAGSSGSSGLAASAERPVPGKFHSAAPDAPTTAEAKRAVEKSMKDAMRAQDVAVGLGPEGPVLSALQDATYGGLAPDHGNAVFLAVVDASGTVVDLRLIASNGGEPGWSDTRERAMQALKGKKLSLRGGGGAELRIAVVSDVRLPSGNTPGAPIRSGLTSGTFDVTDISAKPRRIVSARLVSISSL